MIELEQEQNRNPQIEFEVEPERDVTIEFDEAPRDTLDWDDAPVLYSDVTDAWKRSTIKNIPAMTGVAAFGTAALTGLFSVAGAVAGSTVGPVGTAVGAIAGATAAQATALFIASKVIPGVMAGADFLSLYSKKNDRRDFHISEPEEDPTSNMSDFDKGVVQAMTVGFVRPGGEDTTSRKVGNIMASIARDMLVFSGIPVTIPFVGKEVASITMFNASMGATKGFEKYNEVRLMPSKKQDAIKIGLAKGVGTFVGGQFGFIMMPRILTKISSKMVNGGISGLNPIHGGVTFGGFDTASKLTSDAMISTLEGVDNREITDKFKLTWGEAGSSVLGGALFTGALWSSGKLLTALHKGATNKIQNSLGARMKREALAMADEIKSKNTRVTYDGKIMQEVQHDLPQVMLDKTVADIETAIKGGKTAKVAIREQFETMPGEYLTEKNLISVLEYFSNVK